VVAPAAGWWSWGSNSSGCCGVGDTTTRKQTPTAMLLNPAAEISLGDLNGFGLLSGQLYGWGSNGFGRLGFSSAVSTQPTPTLVPSFSGVAQAAAAAGWGAALKTDGTLWFTGRNDQGQFGNGSFTTSGHFGFVQTTSGLPATISRMVLAIDNITALIDSAGQVWMAGSRGSNRIPDGISGGAARYTTFFQCTLLTPPIIDLAFAAGAGIALYNDHTVYVWGDVSMGRAGDGVNYSSSTRFTSPTLVPGLTGVAAIAATNDMFFALKNDGTMWAWGENRFQGGGITGVSADSGDPLLSPTRWSNATSLSVSWMGTFSPYVYSTLLLGTDSKMYGSGENNQSVTGLVCRLAEQPSGTSTWTTIPGPTHGYPEFELDVATTRRLDRILVMGENATFVRYAAPPVAFGQNQVSIVG
jgi:alpha-tubulin suppressor-like RCC1 family protein